MVICSLPSFQAADTLFDAKEVRVSKRPSALERGKG